MWSPSSERCTLRAWANSSANPSYPRFWIAWIVLVFFRAVYNYLQGVIERLWSSWFRLHQSLPYMFLMLRWRSRSQNIHSQMFVADYSANLSSLWVFDVCINCHIGQICACRKVIRNCINRAIVSENCCNLNWIIENRRISAALMSFRTILRIGVELWVGVTAGSLTAFGACPAPSLESICASRSLACCGPFRPDGMSFVGLPSKSWLHLHPNPVDRLYKPGI